ncbi:MAG TPA: methyltransferase domain-containing protein [Gemmatimonadales bacterium]|nr:methyltransferase domain-containing protein [Gemmatimonadales bacterium]
MGTAPMIVSSPRPPRPDAPARSGSPLNPGIRAKVHELTSTLRQVARRAVPASWRAWLHGQRTGGELTPPPGWIRFGSLRRSAPISRRWGKDRGTPIDRYYIERFLATHAEDIRGRVLEIGGAMYTRKFGGSAVVRSDVLHVKADNPAATIVADLSQGEELASDIFDCIILTQTLQCIYDVRAAVKTVFRILRPGGVLLATVGGVSQFSRWDSERWGHYWNFTTDSVDRLLAENFPPGNREVQSFGTVLTATAFLYGLSSQDLRAAELDRHDPDYQVVIAARAVKPSPSR